MLFSPDLLAKPRHWWEFDVSKDEDIESQEATPNYTPLPVEKPRFLTLVYREMETVISFPPSFVELDDLARKWVRLRPGATINYRTPVDHASSQYARLISGPYIYIMSEDSYQIITDGMQGLRVQIEIDESRIIPDKPSSPPPLPPPPPPPPVFEMPALFNLEIHPGQFGALDTTICSEGADMARMPDGTLVDGQFLGKLNIIHHGNKHEIEFTGTRPPGDKYSTDFILDSRVMARLPIAAKPSSAKCHMSILAPVQQCCDVVLTLSPPWKFGFSWPPGETLDDGKLKYSLRLHPGGAFEHFKSSIVSTTLYYEAVPDSGSVDPNDYISPRNGYAMAFQEFITHLISVLEKLGMSLHARTNFLNIHMPAFAAHKNIAYRFLPASRVAAAIDISVNIDPCYFTRLFLIFRGLSDEDVGLFTNAGQTEASSVDWRQVIGCSEKSKDATLFRVLETSVFEVC